MPVARGGGLRLYFERPWYSSGAEEQVDAAAKAIHRTFRLQEPEAVDAAVGASAG